MVLFGKVRAGYSITELLVVIAIMVFLATAAVASTAGTRRQFEFVGDFNAISNYLREARSLALSNELANGKQPLGYGVRIHSSQSPVVVTLFRRDEGVSGPQERELRTARIDKFSVELRQDGGKAGTAEFFYEPPYGFANFSNRFRNIAIILRDLEYGREKAILVNRISGIPEEGK